MGNHGFTIENLASEHSLFFNVFQCSSIGQAVVDNNLNVISANNKLLQIFQAKQIDIIGLSFGSAFECTEYLRDRQQCGNKKKCTKCGLLDMVTMLLCADSDISSDAIQLPFRIGKHRITRWFYLSGSKINGQFAALAFIDITDVIYQERLLRKKLTLDLATGAMNKHSLVNALERLLEPNTVSCHFTIAMIDFDNFKYVNDQFGHLMGDKVLITFADITRRYIRKHDILGRYGGEEFILVFHETDPKQALQILDRIHKELITYFTHDIMIPVTFSAGVMQVNKEYGLPQYTDLIGRVDKLLYQAKERGRCRAITDMGEYLFNNNFK